MDGVLDLEFLSEKLEFLETPLLLNPKFSLSPLNWALRSTLDIFELLLFIYLILRLVYTIFLCRSKRSSWLFLGTFHHICGRRALVLAGA